MNLCVDQGNSSVKLAVFEGDNICSEYIFQELTEHCLDDIFDRFPIKNCIISCVGKLSYNLYGYLQRKSVYYIELDHNTAIPVDNQYGTPQTLGKDRIAAVVGANYLKPYTDLLVIDAGSAITIDFIDSNGIYWGGNISPGLRMRFRALNTFTEKLPLLEPVSTVNIPLLGNDTHSAILGGVVNGIIFELEGYIEKLKIKYPSLSIFLTGGDIFYFETKLKNTIFAQKNLVLIGLNRILQYNAQN